MSHRCYAGGVRTLDGSTPIQPTAWCACGWEQEFTDWNDAASAVRDHRGVPLDRPSPLSAPECCPHDAERHGPEAGGCIECRCRVVVKADRPLASSAQATAVDK